MTDLSDNSGNIVDIAESTPSTSKTQKKKRSIDLKTECEKMNKRYAVVGVGGTVRVADFSQDEITFLKRNDWLTIAGNHWVTTEDEEEGKTKRVCVAKKWLEWPLRRTHERLVFKPSNEDIPDNAYNIWRGWAFTPDKEKGQFNLFFDHIKTNICAGNEDHYNWVIGWLCDLFQNPCHKLGVALVLRSPEEGTGKGRFATHIGKLLGKHYAAYLQSGQIVGKFNAHLRDKLLIFMDEAVWAGDKQARGVLYGLITESRISIEAKGMMPEQADSYVRLIMASNLEWVAPAGMEARRFSVLDVAPYSQNNVEYFVAIEKQLENGGYEALLHYFLTTPYDRNVIRIPLKTSALLDQKIAGLENEVAWFFEILNFNKIGEYDLYGLDGTIISTENFYLAYMAWTEKNSIRKPCSRIALARNINKACGLAKAGIPLASTWHGGSVGNAYKLLPVTSYRAAFEEKIKQPIKWEE